MNAGDIIHLVRLELHDPGGDRWTDEAMARLFNAAQRQTVLVRPAANARTMHLALASGTLQSIPDDGLSFIDAPRNINADGTSGAPITQTDRESLDTALGDWHGEDEAEEVDHYTWDDRRPREFYVAPPAKTGIEIELVYSRSPAAITAPAEGEDWPDMEIDAAYAGPVQSWMLHLAYMVDTGEGSGGKAAHHYQSFYQALGEKVRADGLVAPPPLTRKEARQ